MELMALARRVTHPLAFAKPSLSRSMLNDAVDKSVSLTLNLTLIAWCFWLFAFTLVVCVVLGRNGDSVAIVMDRIEKYYAYIECSNSFFVNFSILINLLDDVI